MNTTLKFLFDDITLTLIGFKAKLLKLHNLTFYLLHMGVLTNC